MSPGIVCAFLHRTRGSFPEHTLFSFHLYPSRRTPSDELCNASDAAYSTATDRALRFPKAWHDIVYSQHTECNTRDPYLVWLGRQDDDYILVMALFPSLHEASRRRPYWKRRNFFASLDSFLLLLEAILSGL